MKNILLTSLLSLNIATCAMHSSSSSSSSASIVPITWDNLLAHPLSHLTHIFTLAGSEFAEQKKDAFKLIAQLTTRRFEHNRKVNSVAFNHNGTQLATGSNVGKARTYDLASGNQIHNFAHSDRIYSVAFNHNGTQLATGCGNYLAYVYDLVSGERIHLFLHDDSVYSVAFNHDGAQLATGCRDGRARIYDFAQKTNKIIRKPDYFSSIYSVAFNHDGTQLATTCDKGKTRIYDLAHSEQIYEFDHTNSAYSFNYDGTQLAIGCDDKKARIFDLEQDEQIHEFDHTDWIRSVAFNHDGTQLATACGDDKARIFPVSQIYSIVNTMSLAHYHLLKALQTAVLSNKQIHADQEQWETWESLQHLLPEISIKRLKWFIIDSSVQAPAMKKLKRKLL